MLAADESKREAARTYLGEQNLDVCREEATNTLLTRMLASGTTTEYGWLNQDWSALLPARGLPSCS
eukprot:1143071-Pelagomonas_calceolata.AAC.2